MEYKIIYQTSYRLNTGSFKTRPKNLHKIYSYRNVYLGIIHHKHLYTVCRRKL